MPARAPSCGATLPVAHRLPRLQSRMEWFTSAPPTAKFTPSACLMMLCPGFNLKFFDPVATSVGARRDNCRNQALAQSCAICSPGRRHWHSLAVSDPEKRVVALEGCVQTEDVTDLKGGAVVHHEVATDNYVYVVWRRRRKHRFQLARARLHLLLQARS